MEDNNQVAHKDTPFQFAITKKALAGSLAGNILIGIGGATLRVSHMGNDPFSAMNMALSDILPVSLGAFQILLNCVLILVQLKWGRKYMGIGTVINMFFLGYIIQYAIPMIEGLIGVEGSHSLLIKIIIMMAGLLFIALGIAFYQEANAGVSPYDYLSLGMTEALPTPYFANRVITDGGCMLAALSTWIFGALQFSECHIGVGTFVTVFCLGPFVAMFNGLFVKRLFRKV